MKVRQEKEKRKTGTNFYLTTSFLIEKYQTISINFKILITYCQNSTQTTKLKPNQALFSRVYWNLTSFCSWEKVKVFQWLSKSKFLSFMLKWTQTMEIKQNQTFFHGTY